MSIRTRLTIWTVGFVMILVAAFAAGVFLFVRARLESQLDEKLESAFVSLRETVEHHPDEAYELEKQGLVHYEVLEEGRTLFRTDAWPRVGGNSNFKVKRGSFTEEGRRFEIAVAVDETPVRNAMSTLALILGLGLPLTAALALLGGYLVAGRLLAPVGAMAAKAQEITADRLSDRLPVGNPGDELGRLATVINSTLGRLQSSFDQLRRFTADASHELRTPLTALRSVGEVAIQKPLDAAGYRDVIASMLEEVDRLGRLVDSLLTLTRADAQAVRIEPQRVDLEKLAGESAELLRVLADEKGQSLTVESSGGAAAHADPALLRLSVVNLIDNAIKYSPQGGRIRVSVAPGRIEVADTGPGIASEHRDRIFDRFYRVDKARSREDGGVGLGLAIAKWAAEVNGGSIQLDSEDGKGSVFTIMLPESP